jgi:ABC-2 type transport system ATP-binding protein
MRWGLPSVPAAGTRKQLTFSNADCVEIHSASPARYRPMALRPAFTPMNAFGSAGPLVEIENLSKRYGAFEAVSEFSLSVGAGELFALLGPNGAGKTTTIRMLMGILQPSTGSARIRGLDCFSDRVEVMRLVGYLPDEPVFYDYLRGGEIIRFIGEMHGFTKGEIAQRTGGLLERLELEEAVNEFAVNYSKGMKKKLALICAMLHDPALLILDEPTNGLDPFATRTLHEIMREKVAEGRTVFFSTHLLDQAERLCSRMAIIHRGRLAAVGSLTELRANLPPESTLEEVFFALTGASKEEQAPNG